MRLFMIFVTQQVKLDFYFNGQVFFAVVFNFVQIKQFIVSRFQSVNH